MSEPDYHVEIPGLDESQTRSAAPPSSRPWLGIRFDCCGVYVRVYRNPDASAYEGRCPRCLRSVRLPIGPGGFDSRFFKAE